MYYCFFKRHSDKRDENVSKMRASFDNGTVQVLQASLIALMELQERAVERLL